MNCSCHACNSKHKHQCIHQVESQGSAQKGPQGKPPSLLDSFIASWKSFSGLSLWISGLLLATGLLGEDWLETQLGSFRMQLFFFAFPYILCGWPVLYAGVKSFCKLDFFNEFTLMGGATVAAMLLGEWPEAVGVMLFYRLGEAISERAAGNSRRSIQALLAAKPSVMQESAVKILVLVEKATANKMSTEKFLTRLARYYTPAVVGAAALVALIPPLAGYGEFSEWLYRALVLLVISCPCALIISIPLGYFGGIGAASRQGILLKGSYVLDALHSIKSIALDETSINTSEQAIKDLQAEGYKITMLSGDCTENTAALAQKLGVNYEANLLPESKALALSKLAAVESVLFVGEGLNAAPVLAMAKDMFKAMKTSNRSGAEISIALETADAVILDDSSAKLPKLFKLAAKTRTIIWQNIIFALSVKIAFIALGIVGLSGLWEAVFADVGVSLLAILNSTRAMRDI